MKFGTPKRVYLDYASATPVDLRVSTAMQKIAHKCTGNPSAIHKEGRDAKKVLDEARKGIATLLGAREKEIIFTSGATESNNLAIIGLFRELKERYEMQGRSPHIITSTIEHKSVLEAVKSLQSEGATVTYLIPDESGLISAKDLREAIMPETMLVSLMYVNNETGVVSDIEEFSKEIRHARRKKEMVIEGTPYLHIDAVQAINLLPINLAKMHADFLTLHSPKVYGPAGIGLLYKRTGLDLKPILYGGGQEDGLRSGRELPLLAHGFWAALLLAGKDREKEWDRLKKLKDFFTNEIFKIFPNARLNVSEKISLPSFINIFIPKLDAEFGVIYLDEKGVACSSASTCMNNALDSYSYVIKEMFDDELRAQSSLRFTFGRQTSKADILHCVKALRALKLSQCL